MSENDPSKFVYQSGLPNKSQSLEENENFYSDIEDIRDLLSNGLTDPPDIYLLSGTHVTKSQVTLYKKKAKTGDAFSQYMLAKCYQEGYGVPISDHESVRYYTLAFDNGFKAASFPLAQLLHARKDYKKALPYWRVCSKLNMGTAWTRIVAYQTMGDYAAKGITTNRRGSSAKHYEMAFALISSLAEEGDKLSEVALGDCCKFGLGTKKSPRRAFKIYSEAALKQNPWAMYRLGTCFRLGQGIRQCDEEAIRYYKLAGTAGIMPALYSLAELLHMRKRYGEAFQYFVTYAAGNDANINRRVMGLRYLADYYLNGLGNPKSIEMAEDLSKKAFSLLLLLADRKDDRALLEVANCLRSGVGVTPSFEKAWPYYLEAANKGVAWACYEVGTFFEKGKGTDISAKKAIHYYRMAVDRGCLKPLYPLACLLYDHKKFSDAILYWKRFICQRGIDCLEYSYACLGLGQCARDGLGRPRSLKTSQYYYKKAFIELKVLADRGNTDAQKKIAKCFREGLGVAKSTIQAVHYHFLAIGSEESALPAIPWNAFEINKISSPYLKSMFHDTSIGSLNDLIKPQDIPIFIEQAKLGNTDAQYRLGLCYEAGYGVPQSYKKACSYYEIAQLKNHPEAAVKLGSLVMKGLGIKQSYDQALSLFQTAAQAGCSLAFAHVAVFYEKGLVVPRSMIKALEYYKRSVEEGFGSSYFNLAQLYQVLQGTIAKQRCYEAAFHFFLPEAIKGESWAQVHLGDICLAWGKDKDYEQQALGYYTDAARQNCPLAFDRLAKLYEEGKGVERSHEEAERLYKLSVERGHTASLVNLAKLFHRLDRHHDAICCWKTYLQLRRGQLWELAEACQRLGDYYRKGEGVRKSKKCARHYYHKALSYAIPCANADMPEGQSKLRRYHASCLEVSDSLEEAVDYFSKALKQQHPWAYEPILSCFKSDNRANKGRKSCLQQEQLTRLSYQFCIIAEQDHVFAMKKVASLLHSRRRFNEALPYWQKLSECSSYATIHATALQFLGECYESNSRVAEQSRNLAKQCYRDAFLKFESLANQGHAYAQVQLGRCFLEGLGIDKSPQRAFHYYQLSAFQGDSNGSYGLAICFQHGIGVTSSNEEALRNFELAYKAGLDECLYDWAHLLYFMGDYKKAINRFSQYLEKVDSDFERYGWACWFLGECYRYRLAVCPGDGGHYYQKAVAHFIVLANAGQASAKAILGDCYRDGLGVPPSHRQAQRYYLEAIDIGHVSALYSIAGLYYTDKRYKKAYHSWKAYLDICDQDELRQAWANHYLGEMFEQGLGFRPLPVKAQEFHARAFHNFQSSARHGDIDSLVMLGDYFRYGKGVRKSIAQAQYHYGMAVEKGSYIAQMRLADLQPNFIVDLLDQTEKQAM